MDKTNAMRIADGKGIKYTVREYDAEITDGETVAAAVGVDADRVFKTLVTVGNDRKNYVFVIPVNHTLDMKKAAKSVGVKNAEMIKQKELFPLTGYVHGGCSPIGMKKQFKTVLDETAMLYDKIAFSGGRRGTQIEMSPEELRLLTGAEYADLCRD